MSRGGNGGAGGGLIADLANPWPEAVAVAGEARRPWAASGASGAASVAPTEPLARRFRVESVAPTMPGVIGGGGGGGGYFGGGGGGGGNGGAGGGGGGGGSSFTAPGATAVVHEQGVKAANGSVTISW